MLHTTIKWVLRAKNIRRFITIVKVVDSCWIFSTKWSDTFRSFCIRKGARIMKKIHHNRAKKFTFLRRFDRKKHGFWNI